MVRLTRDNQPACDATQGDEPDHGNDEHQIFTSHETSRLRVAIASSRAKAIRAILPVALGIEPISPDLTNRMTKASWSVGGLTALEDKRLACHHKTSAEVQSKTRAARGLPKMNRGTLGPELI